MNRIIALDIAKAICIILVVMGHYVPDNSPAWYVLVHDVIYTFHMPLFMFVSGYVYIATKKRSTYGDFLLKKVRRLMVPYLTTSVMVIVIKLLTQGSMSVRQSRDNIFFRRDVLYARGRLFPVVYLGVVVDVCAGAAIQRKAETCRVVCLRHCLTFHSVWIASSLLS